MKFSISNSEGIVIRRKSDTIRKGIKLYGMELKQVENLRHLVVNRARGDTDSAAGRCLYRSVVTRSATKMQTGTAHDIFYTHSYI
ncbi:hypothetical protein PR048_029487 [Dryococelus australis]|uniref:Uncharacterized protein n=1 Tax=Dryococelus australis TaxID=614101 RepID=A0ABQ9GDH9_9NEOP|nr:hypothetical protein PR048_029487 [Dryococelus australis]